MAYTSVRGRKPLERASKISHSHVIASPVVQELLGQCLVPSPADPAALEGAICDVPPPTDQQISMVVAVDGSMREVPVREEFPAATVTFFTFGPLLFKLEALRELDNQPFIAPEDLAKLKNIQRYAFALPTRSISRRELTLRDSIRRSLHEFFSRGGPEDEPLYNALHWVLFEEWAASKAPKEWVLPSCPNHGCERRDIVFRSEAGNEQKCDLCGKPIYLIDAARLHERVDEELGGGGVSSYVLALCEQIVLVHVIRAVWQMKPTMLGEILFIKDGPLAFFGQTAPFSKPFRNMTTALSELSVIGLEKTGAFVEHAVQIDDQLRPGTVLPLSNEYIYKYIIPGDPQSADPYGSNTYWGGKLIFKASDGSTYVATVPTRDGFGPNPKYESFLNLTKLLDAVSELRCSMYDNALIPVALANRLVSLSDVPSARILETFAKASVQRVEGR